jgi:chorismate synthase
MRKAGSSVGAVIEVTAEGVPAGSARRSTASSTPDIAAAMMSINAVKGVEIGDGLAAARSPARQTPTRSRIGADGRPRIPVQQCRRHLGGISTGQDVVVRFAVKPTSSILTTARHDHQIRRRETEIVTKGRHDPCVGIRAVPWARR